MENTKIKLREFNIKKIDYTFQNNFSEVTDAFPGISPDFISDKELDAKVESEFSVQLGIHNNLKDIYVETDCRVTEGNDLSKYLGETDGEKENNIFILRSLDISIRYYFDFIDLDEDTLKEIQSEAINAEKIEEMRTKIENYAIDISLQHTTNMIKSITSLDFKLPIQVEYPSSIKL